MAKRGTCFGVRAILDEKENAGKEILGVIGGGSKQLLYTNKDIISTTDKPYPKWYGRILIEYADKVMGIREGVKLRLIHDKNTHFTCSGLVLTNKHELRDKKLWMIMSKGEWLVEPVVNEKISIKKINVVTKSPGLKIKNTKLKVGELVMIRKSSKHYGDPEAYNPIKTMGEIIHIDMGFNEDYIIEVKWPNSRSTWYRPSDLKRITPKKQMKYATRGQI